MNQRDIRFAKVMFSNNSGSKIRPVLVISNKNHNNSMRDVLCCPITSNPANLPGTLELRIGDFEDGKLNISSRVKVTQVVALAKEELGNQIATITRARAINILNRLNNAIIID
ncbi:MAG: type II toxin-antitoxin system PemK/MazF family toxin [Candidatus Woesearchaeota archaeon]